MSDDDEKSVPPVAGFLQTFRAQDFREGFFKAIGHRYFMAIQRILTEEKPTKRFTQEQWRDKLGVSRITVWRWKQDRNFAGAEKFFAAQLLLTDLPIANLRLPTNDEILLDSICTMYSFLNRKFLSIRPNKPLTAEVFRAVYKLMRVMQLQPYDLYNPFGDQKENSKSKALDSLAAFLNDQQHAILPSAQSADAKEIRRARPKILPSDVKMWLDTWGMPHSLFALGNHALWKQIGEIK